MSNPNFSFTRASLEAAGISSEDIEFYVNAHIDRKDGSGFMRFLSIQHCVAQHFERAPEVNVAKSKKQEA